MTCPCLPLAQVSCSTPAAAAVMGQGLSCSGATSMEQNDLLTSIQLGDLDHFEAILLTDPSLLHQPTRLSALHIAAANGQIELLCMILDRSVNPDILNRHRQTPLMLAAMHGKLSCVLRLLQAGANILMFDSIHSRTCLHYAAHSGHSECLQAILSAAHSSPVSDSWSVSCLSLYFHSNAMNSISSTFRGFVRFVNVRDANGATPLHLAARQRRPQCLHLLLDSGALVCAPTSGGYGCQGSTPLHLAARGGSLDCIRALLAWGADRLHRDASGKIPYGVAIKYKHGACAALLNPLSAEPLVWPSPLKFINELNQEAKLLLERALMDANRERENNILKGTSYSQLSSPCNSDSGLDDNVSEASDTELCCICFDHVCTIEVQDCGHQMCAPCTLALCCHNKPNPTTSCITSPVCPFCRSNIAQLVVAKTKIDNETDKDLNSSKLRRSRRLSNYSEGSSSFKGLSTMGSFGKMGGRMSGKVAAESSDWIDKP